jgi:hypothetical protein
MIKHKDWMVTEEGIQNFVEFLEKESGKLSNEDKGWLFEKGREIFEHYYVDHDITVNVASEEDSDILDKHFGLVQTTTSNMYAHILLLEFKLRMLNRKLNI